MRQIRNEESFGRHNGAQSYVELKTSDPDLRGQRVIDIAREAAVMSIDAHQPHTDYMAPNLVVKATVKEIENQTFQGVENPPK